MTTHWERYDRHWRLLRPPLRPNAEVIASVRDLIDDGGDAPCLLLGSTAEFAALGRRVVAVDMSLPMMRTLWAAANPGQSGIQADWTRMPIRTASISHVLGDGSLNSVPFEAVLPRMLEEVVRVLGSGGALVARVFCRPAVAETLDTIRRDVTAGKVESFHPLKWRVAMASVQRADIAVEDIRETVLAMFPDRTELCRTTGWRREEVDTIEVYAGSPAIYNFPTEAMILDLLRQHFAEVALVRCGSYALAERCPIIVARTAG